MVPRYIITLSAEQRHMLESITKRGQHNSRSVLLSLALLLCDVGPGGPARETKFITETLGLSSRTIERLKKKFIENGLDAIKRKPRKPAEKTHKFTGAFEEKLIALACSEAPSGRARWTIRLLAAKAVELAIVDSVSPMTIQRTLKRASINLF